MLRVVGSDDAAQFGDRSPYSGGLRLCLRITEILVKRHRLVEGSVSHPSFRLRHRHMTVLQRDRRTTVHKKHLDPVVCAFESVQPDHVVRIIGQKQRSRLRRLQRVIIPHPSFLRFVSHGSGPCTSLSHSRESGIHPGNFPTESSVPGRTLRIPCIPRPFASEPVPPACRLPFSETSRYSRPVRRRSIIFLPPHPPAVRPRSVGEQPAAHVLPVTDKKAANRPPVRRPLFSFCVVCHFFFLFAFLRARASSCCFIFFSSAFLLSLFFPPSLLKSLTSDVLTSECHCTTPRPVLPTVRIRRFRCRRRSSS